MARKREHAVQKRKSIISAFYGQALRADLQAWCPKRGSLVSLLNASTLLVASGRKGDPSLIVDHCRIESGQITAGIQHCLGSVGKHAPVVQGVGVLQSHHKSAEYPAVRRSRQTCRSGEKGEGVAEIVMEYLRTYWISLIDTPSNTRS